MFSYFSLYSCGEKNSMAHTKNTSSLLLWIAVVFTILMLLIFVPAVVAQSPGDDAGSQAAVYSFPDGKQVSVRYKRAPATAKEVLRPGKLWTPGGSPAFLFTEAELRIGDSTLAPGAYSIYLIPGKENWTFIVSGAVTGDSPYNEKQELLRARMETGELPDRAEQVTIYFGMTGPKECDMRVDYGKTRAWIEFKEK